MSQKVKKERRSQKKLKKGAKFLTLLNKESVRAEMERLAKKDALMATSAK